MLREHQAWAPGDALPARSKAGFEREREAEGEEVAVRGWQKTGPPSPRAHVQGITILRDSISFFFFKKELN